MKMVLLQVSLITKKLLCQGGEESNCRILVYVLKMTYGLGQYTVDGKHS